MTSPTPLALTLAVAMLVGVLFSLVPAGNVSVAQESPSVDREADWSDVDKLQAEEAAKRRRAARHEGAANTASETSEAVEGDDGTSERTYRKRRRADVKRRTRRQ